MWLPGYLWSAALAVAAAETQRTRVVLSARRCESVSHLRVGVVQCDREPVQLGRRSITEQRPRRTSFALPRRDRLLRGGAGSSPWRWVTGASTCEVAEQVKGNRDPLSAEGAGSHLHSSSCGLIFPSSSLILGWFVWRKWRGDGDRTWETCMSTQVPGHPLGWPALGAFLLLLTTGTVSTLSTRLSVSRSFSSWAVSLGVGRFLPPRLVVGSAVGSGSSCCFQYHAAWPSSCYVCSRVDGCLRGRIVSFPSVLSRVDGWCLADDGHEFREILLDARRAQ